MPKLKGAHSAYVGHGFQWIPEIVLRQQKMYTHLYFHINFFSAIEMNSSTRPVNLAIINGPSTRQKINGSIQ